MDADAGFAVDQNSPRASNHDVAGDVPYGRPRHSPLDDALERARGIQYSASGVSLDTPTRSPPLPVASGHLPKGRIRLIVPFYEPAEPPNPCLGAGPTEPSEMLLYGPPGLAVSNDGLTRTPINHGRAFESRPWIR